MVKYWVWVVILSDTSMKLLQNIRDHFGETWGMRRFDGLRLSGSRLSLLALILLRMPITGQMGMFEVGLCCS